MVAQVALAQPTPYLPFVPIGYLPAIPTLDTPTDGQTGVSVTPTVTWNAASGAVTYDVEISNSAQFTIVVDQKYGTALTNYPLTVELGIGSTYFWRVRATNTVGNSDWSTVWDFTTETGTITHDTSLAGTGTQGATKTLSFTVGNFSNRELLVWLVCYQPDTNLISITTATWDGTALDSVARVDYSNDHSAIMLYHLTAPAVTTANISITSAYSNTFMRILGSSWYGVNQTTPLGTAVTNFSDTGTSDSVNVTVTSAVGEVVVDGAVAEYQFVSHGAGQTQRALDETDGMWTATSKSGAASVLMYHIVSDTLASWGTIAIPLKP